MHPARLSTPPGTEHYTSNAPSSAERIAPQIGPHDDAAAAASNADPRASKPVKTKTKSRPQPEQAKYILRRQTWERERTAQNPILQFLHPLPASRSLSAKLMEETAAKIDADPRQHEDGPATRFFSYAERLFGMLYLHAQEKDMLFPDLVRRIQKIPVGPLYEHAFAKMFSASNVHTLKKQSAESLIKGTYLLDNADARHKVLYKLQTSVFAGDYDKRIQLIRAIPNQQDKDRLIDSFIPKTEDGYMDIMLSLYSPELLDMVQDPNVHKNLCNTVGRFNNPESQLIIHLASGDERALDNYLDHAPFDHESATAVLKHIDRLSPALRAPTVRDILREGGRDPRERHALLSATIKGGAYRHLSEIEADALIKEMILTTHPSVRVRALPLIGRIADPAIREELFDTYRNRDDENTQFALFDAALQTAPHGLAPRILQCLDELLSHHLDANQPYRVMTLLFVDNGQAVASHEGLAQQIIDRFLLADDPRFKALAPELVRLIDNPESRSAVIESFCESEHPELAFHGACLEVHYAKSAKEAEEQRPLLIRWLQAGYNLNGFAYDVKKLFALLFATPGDEGEQDDFDPSLILRQGPKVQDALAAFLVEARGEPHYDAMLAALTDLHHYELPATIISRLSLDVDKAGKAEIAYAQRVAEVHRGFASPYPQGMAISDMAQGLLDFWDTAANLGALQTGHDVFQEALARDGTAELLHTGSSGMHELEALCLLSSLIDPVTIKRAKARAEAEAEGASETDGVGDKYDGSELRVVLADYQKFLDHALKPESCAKFAMAREEAFDEHKMRNFLEQERGTILKAMILLKNGIVYEALRRKKEKFSDFLGRVDKLMYHPQVFHLLHDICHSTDASKRSGAAHAYRMLALTDNFLQANQKGVLLDALEEFKASDTLFSERELRFTFRYLASQYPLWGLGKTLSEDEFKRIGGILDMSHIHLLGPAFQPGNFRLAASGRDRLRSILSETLHGTFDQWLERDPDIAAANRRTQAAFEEAFPGRPAFDTWNKGNVAMFFEGPNGRQYRLAPWQRQPGVDLFLGSKVGICTALDGENPSAILEALIFQVVQQLELTDAETHETVGSSLLFFSKAEGYDKPVLIADHLALNRYLAEDLAMRDGVVSWMRRFSQQVAGYDVPIFMGKNLNYVTLDGLDDSKDLTLSVIGDTDNHLLYANALDRYDGWTDISQSHTRNLFVLYEPGGDAKSTEE